MYGCCAFVWQRALEDAKNREEELNRVQAETRARLDDLKKDYDESQVRHPPRAHCMETELYVAVCAVLDWQYNLGNARLAWKALVKNLKHEEGQVKELTALVTELQGKLQRYAVIDDVEAREAVVARKEVAVGNVEEYEATAAAHQVRLPNKPRTQNSARTAWRMNCDILRVCMTGRVGEQSRQRPREGGGRGFARGAGGGERAARVGAGGLPPQARLLLPSQASCRRRRRHDDDGRLRVPVRGPGPRRRPGQ